MRTGLWRALSLVAIYAIALHTILWGAGLSYGVAVDPKSRTVDREATAPLRAAGKAEALAAAGR